jgi:uncharacterized protein (DUF488 family)
VNTIHTIGHSTYDVDDFIKLLQDNDINTIVDVRSTPYSKFASQYNKDSIKQHLKENKIGYIFMGDLLGARYENKNLLFDNGKVDFKKVQKIKPFQDGITRLEKGINKGYNISLMCSEKEAFDCHRFGLISEFLSKIDVDIQHIYPNKIVSQKQLEQQLLKKYDKKIDYLGLENSKMPINQAYELRNQDIAYNSITKEGDDL